MSRPLDPDRFLRQIAERMIRPLERDEMLRFGVGSQTEGLASFPRAQRRAERGGKLCCRAAAGNRCRLPGLLMLPLSAETRVRPRR